MINKLSQKYIRYFFSRIGLGINPNNLSNYNDINIEELWILAVDASNDILPLKIGRAHV